MKRFLIRIKVYVQRSLVYYQLINSFMIFAIWLKSEDLLLTISLFAILIISVILLGYLDVKKLGLLEYEQTIYNSKNREQKYFIELLEKINKKLDENT